MDNNGSFFAMGGYAAYVWPALLITVVVMAGLLLTSLRRQRVGERDLRQLEARLPQGARRSERDGKGRHAKANDAGHAGGRPS